MVTFDVPPGSPTDRDRRRVRRAVNRGPSQLRYRDVLDSVEPYTDAAAADRALLELVKEGVIGLHPYGEVVRIERVG